MACGGGDDDASDFFGDSASDPTADDSGEGNDDDNGGPPEQGSEADLQAAARVAFEAFLAADDQTYFQAVVRSCREEVGFSGVFERNKGRRFFAQQNGDITLSAVTVRDVVVENFTGSSADVSLVLDGTGDATFKETLPHRWAVDEGAWRSEDCDDFLRGNDMGDSSRDDPLGSGFIADLSGWLIVVRYVYPDGEFVFEEPAKGPPADGNQYFVVDLAADYNGAEVSSVPSEAFVFTFVSGGTEYGEDASCGPVPGEFDRDIAYGPGEQAFGFLCREVDADDADSLLLRIEARDGSGDAWFVLQE